MTADTDIKDIIIYEDSDIIAVRKPCGVASQTERGGAQDMVSMLMNYFHRQGQGMPYVGVVHRLDKNVGGVMVYAKNKKAAANLSSQMAAPAAGGKKAAVKKYYAVIYGGEKLGTEGVLSDMLVRDGRTNTSGVAERGERDAKRAELEYRVSAVGSLNGTEVRVLDITLMTGRHHQIRVQLSSRGCPLVGDKKYGAEANAECGYRGVGLYSYSLTVRHPSTGREMTFTAEPEGDIFRDICLKTT